jgi:putative transposase
MEAIDRQYLKTPFYGIRRMTVELNNQGFSVNHKRIQRLMRLMGLLAIYQKPKTTQRNPEHKVYPYLLRGLVIDRPNQVWTADITYIPMAHGFAYLVAIMDWYSRYVLSWRISTTMDTGFCLEALDEAIQRYGAPEISNTDQGSQFTSQEWINRLLAALIKISMDGRGRFLDNIFIERLWRTVKYEDIYLKRYETVRELRTGLTEYFRFYNEERIHQTLDYKTPAQVYRKGVEKPFKSLQLTLPTFEQLSNTVGYDDEGKRMDLARA